MDGILIIDKPKGWTSNDIVQRVKKLVKEKVGHTGTLDPNATGVLPLLVGKGTLVSKYLINHDKTYEAVLKLGKKTDTADGEGKVLEEQAVLSQYIIPNYIETVFQELLGLQEQIPPMYSAIKINGKKLYEYARKGQTVEIQPRTIEIYDLKLIQIGNDEVTFQVSCSKGTYIRTLCEQIAEKLHTVGYMKELKRLIVGEFSIKDAIELDHIETPGELEKHIISIEMLFQKKEAITLEDKSLSLFLNGVRLSIKQPDGVCRIYNKKHQFIGIATVEQQKLKRDVIIRE